MRTHLERLQVANDGLFFVFVFVLVIVVGCESKPTGPVLVPVRGQVLCDGVPAAGVVLTLHAQDAVGTVATGISLDDGSFVISTNELGDGAEPGDYAITCVWGRFDPLSRSYTNDRLEGKFASPESTPFNWTLKADTPPGHVTIELNNTK